MSAGRVYRQAFARPTSDQLKSLREFFARNGKRIGCKMLGVSEVTIGIILGGGDSKQATLTRLFANLSKIEKGPEQVSTEETS